MDRIEEKLYQPLSCGIKILERVTKRALHPPESYKAKRGQSPHLEISQFSEVFATPSINRLISNEVIASILKNSSEYDFHFERSCGILISDLRPRKYIHRLSIALEKLILINETDDGISGPIQ